MAKIIAKKIPYADSTVYKKGNTITLTAYDYLYGLFLFDGATNQIYVNLPLTKPVYASNFTVALGSTSVSFASVSGIHTISNARIRTSTGIGVSSIQFIITGDFSNTPPSLSPIVVGIEGTTITFT